MSNSKRKLILNYIRDTVFSLITVANGYNFDVQTKKRGLQPIDGLPVSSFPALFITSANETRNNITVNQYFGVIQALIIGYVSNSKGTDAVQEDLDNLIEDLTKALETDRTLGGNAAKWLEMKSISVDDGDMGTFAAFAMAIEINYTTEGITP